MTLTARGGSRSRRYETRNAPNTAGAPAREAIANDRTSSKSGFDVNGATSRLPDTLWRDQRVLVPRAAIEESTIPALSSAAPLFEEKRHTLLTAGEPNVLDPFPSHRACLGATLASHDSPMDVPQIDRGHWPEKRLERDEPHRSGDRPQCVDAINVGRVFDRGAKPHIWETEAGLRQHLTHPIGTLRQNLKGRRQMIDGRASR
jgi:hypothetical protein